MDETASNTPTIVLLIIVTIGLLGGAWVLRSRRNENIRVEEEPRQRRPLTPGTDPELAALISAGQTIEAIKLVRERTGAGLKEAKDHVEALMAGRPAPLPSRPAAVESADLDTEVRELLARGLTIDAIKLVRDRTGKSLKEAKDHVERVAGE